MKSTNRGIWVARRWRYLSSRVIIVSSQNLTSSRVMSRMKEGASKVGMINIASVSSFRMASYRASSRALNDDRNAVLTMLSASAYPSTGEVAVGGRSAQSSFPNDFLTANLQKQIGTLLPRTRSSPSRGTFCGCLGPEPLFLLHSSKR
jgi:hypothetical protein